MYNQIVFIQESLSQIRLLTLHLLNNPLTLQALTRYLEVYFSAIFRCRSISILSEAADFGENFHRLNKQDITEVS